MTQQQFFDEQGDVVEVDLGYGRVALISVEDADITQYRWYLGALRYAQMHKGNSITYLHRLILVRMAGRELQSNEICDHINGNPLDNRRSNLRLASRSQNQWNRRARHDSKTGVNGVTRLKSGKYRARIQRYRKTITLGEFDVLDDAIKARRNAELELFGEFSPYISRQEATS